MTAKSDEPDAPVPGPTRDDLRVGAGHAAARAESEVGSGAHVGVDTARVRAAVRELLLAIGENPDRAELVDTPRRVAESYAEFFAGVGVDPAGVIGDTVPFSPGDSHEPVLVRGLRFRSICEHHLLPFGGVAHVAYVPDDRLIGLGRIPALIEVLAARPQLQERLGEEIAGALQGALGATGVLVVLDARHGCVAFRGPRQVESTTVTVASRGSLAEPAARAELVALIAPLVIGRAAAPGVSVHDDSAPGDTAPDDTAPGASALDGRAPVGSTRGAAL